MCLHTRASQRQPAELSLTRPSLDEGDDDHRPDNHEQVPREFGVCASIRKNLPAQTARPGLSAVAQKDEHGRYERHSAYRANQNHRPINHDGPV
jgi:hypothetical protein